MTARETSFHVGVDGGATRTRVLVVDDDGGERARRVGAGALVRASAPAAGAARLAELVRQALDEAGADSAATLCCALAGAGRTEEREAVEQALRNENLAGTVRVVGDVDAALEDALGDGPGTLLIAGTGSIGVGRGEDGALARVGGWGERLGDEGSGFALGIAALRAVARAHDGRGPETALTADILRFAGVTSPVALIAWADRADKPRIAALAPLVLNAATGDDVAAHIQDDAAADLAAHVHALHRRLGPWPEPPILALAGGLLHETSLRLALLDRIDRDGPPVRALDRPVDPVRGAARLARGMTSS